MTPSKEFERKYAGTPGSSFDPQLREEIDVFLSAHMGGPSVTRNNIEDVAMGQPTETESASTAYHAQLAREFVQGPLWPLVKGAWEKEVQKRFKAFTDAPSDLDNMLRVRWQMYRDAVNDMVSNLESSAQVLYDEADPSTWPQ
jgi:hypothetical protein